MNRAERLTQDGATEDTIVLFYKPHDAFGWGSNYDTDHGLYLPDRWDRGMIWYRSGEHAFQARKMATMEQHDHVNDKRTPNQAKQAGGPKGKGQMREGWGNSYGDLCYYVMLEVTIAKAQQNSFVRNELVKTADAHIYEDSETDDIWGWRYHQDHRGKNLLGECWMMTRELVR